MNGQADSQFSVAAVLRAGLGKIPFVAARRRRKARRAFPPDLSEEERRIVQLVRPYTMTTVDRIVGLVHAVQYLVRHRIPGAIVECGVWRGGSMMAAAATLLAAGDDERELYCYDTFEGMTAPTPVDVSYWGDPAAELLARDPKGTGLWCYASKEDVAANLARTGYPPERIHLIAGRVEDTIPGRIPPGPIALLRLDTDWYESTRHELDHLYPRLVSGGVLIADDYGHWQGAKRAVDEYLGEHPSRIFLHRIDYSARLAIKP
jgi:O-methyltransferase